MAPLLPSFGWAVERPYKEKTSKVVLRLVEKPRSPSLVLRRPKGLEKKTELLPDELEPS